MLQIDVFRNVFISFNYLEHDQIVIKCSDPRNVRSIFIYSLCSKLFFLSINSEQGTLETTAEICMCPEVKRP